MNVHRLRNREARRLFLAHHALIAPAHDLLALIEQLGFVQIDSINTVERAHHMILAARHKQYRPQQLQHLLEESRQLFEHWTHDAAIIPTAYFLYWRLRFERAAAQLAPQWQAWQRGNFIDRLEVLLERVRDHGPVRARDVTDRSGRRSTSGGGWWSWHPSKTALEFLWRTGKLAISRREDFQKVFDLTARVIPQEHFSASCSSAEALDWACAGALDRLGFATAGEIAAFWGAATLAEAQDWGQRNLLAGALTEIDVEAADGRLQRAFARPDISEKAHATSPPSGGIRVLSPFDPLLRDRKRCARLFGFHYRIEVFVPALQRRYGYYVFPLLERDRLIGRIDMRRQHHRDSLTVRALWPEPGVKFGKQRLHRLTAELHRIARFCGCEQLGFDANWLRLGFEPKR